MLRKIAVISMLMISGIAPAMAAPRALYDIALDMDGNGKAERAVLVLNNPAAGGESAPLGDIYNLGDDETVDLFIYMDAGDALLDISKPPQFRKDNVVDRERFNWVGPLESNGRQSLKLYASHAPGSSATEDETLTIVYRKGAFLVAGLDLYWDGGGKNGNCQYNFLTQKGYTAPGELAENKTPIRRKVKALPLAAWTPDTRPKVCDVP